ncbi:sulfotransferase domain-containing protein [Lacinutrix salivirga]
MFKFEANRIHFYLKTNTLFYTMLIIAIPKSASSSLLKTVSEAHNIEGVQDFSFRNNAIPNGCNMLHTVHSDIRELTPEIVTNLCKDSRLYKQHIFPSAINLKLLEDKKKVVLLREPIEILEAYLRGAKFKFNGLPPSYSVDLTTDQLLEKAKQDGFYDDLVFFYNQWKQKSGVENTLFVEYNAYIANPKKTLNAIEAFFELPVTKTPVKALKARYAKESSFKKFKVIIKTNAIKVLNALGIKNAVKGIFKP